MELGGSYYSNRQEVKFETFEVPILQFSRRLWNVVERSGKF
jgi:hypothetical protein